MSSCVRTLGVYMFQMLVGYVLMCAVMTFNGYIFIATVLGYGLGYWLFGLTMMKLSAKNLLKSQDVPIKCKNCTTVSISSNYVKYHYNLTYFNNYFFFKGKETSESTSTNISDDIPGTSSTIEVEIHGRL